MHLVICWCSLFCIEIYGLVSFTPVAIMHIHWQGNRMCLGLCDLMPEPPSAALVILFLFQPTT